MRFAIITNYELRECLSGMLMNNYQNSYEDFREFVKLEITPKEFKEFRNRPISNKEISSIVDRSNKPININLKMIESLWNRYEKEIICAIKEVTGILVNADEITCYVDPYQKAGYYGDDTITVGYYDNPQDMLFVITHELFHIFYWRSIRDLNITKNSPGCEEMYEWIIAEATVYLLTINSVLRTFWPDIAIDSYNEVASELKGLKHLWDNNSFEDYIIKSYDLMKRK